MKTNLKNTLLVSSLLILGSNIGFAQEYNNIKWAKGPFWKAPRLSELNIKLKVTQSNLEEACDQYKEVIFSSDGQENWPDQPKRIDRIRKMPLPDFSMSTSSFATNFEITNVQDRRSVIEEFLDVSSKVEIDESKEILPLFTHLKATTGASLQDIDAFKINYIPGKNSFTKVSSKLGLEESPINVESGLSGNLIIKIEGRDVACDLLHGNIKIIASAPSYIRLPKEDTAELETFYHSKLTPQLNKILAVPAESLVIKSARLGFHMSKILDEELHMKDSELIGRHIKSLIDALFVPKTLDASINMVEINKKKVIDLKSSINSEPVTLNLSVN